MTRRSSWRALAGLLLLTSLAGWSWALWQFAPRLLTNGKGEPPQAEPVSASAVGLLSWQIEAPLPPSEVTLRVVLPDGSLAAEWHGAGLDEGGEKEVEIPAEGAEVMVAAVWEGFLPGSRAVRVRLFWEGQAASEFAAWGRDERAEAHGQLPGSRELMKLAEMAERSQAETGKDWDGDREASFRGDETADGGVVGSITGETLGAANPTGNATDEFEETWDEEHGGEPQ